MKKVALVFLFILAGMSLIFSQGAKDYGEDDYYDGLEELSKLSPKELCELLSTEENENFITLYVLTLTKEGFESDNEIPPVTEKRFKEILKEIENLEGKVKKKVKKSGYLKKDGYAYKKAFGNTFLVNLKADTPYSYYRIRNPEADNGLNDFIGVFYSRPSKKGYIIFTGLRLNLENEPDDDLSLDSEDFVDMYNECKEKSEFTSSIKIDGKKHTVFFMDIEDELE